MSFERYDPETIFLSNHIKFLKNSIKNNYSGLDLSLQAYYQESINEPDLEEDLLKPRALTGLRYEKSTTPSSFEKDDTLLSLRAIMMIRAYRVCGHLAAQLDPLSLSSREEFPELDPESFGFSPHTFDIVVNLDGVLGLHQAKIQDVIQKLKETYCGSVGFEFMHLQDAQKKSWLQERIEKGLPQPSFNERKEALHHLIKTEAFERFLQTKFPGAKRFGIEGAESFIVAFEFLLKEQAKDESLEEIVIGMAHRGRLCVLYQVFDQDLKNLYAQFQGIHTDSGGYQSHFSGDVKYHKGFCTNKIFHNRKVRLNLLNNPSHLEAVNPVVLGVVRRAQEKEIKKRLHQTGSEHFREVTGILVHGDAAFAGQGLVAETLELANLDGFQTNGTIHLIINNQIGFTTSPPMSRSSPYASDLAKVINAPIFHVNGDEVDTLIDIVKIASAYKNAFKSDVVIDLVCYRRQGHNESDEPMFTQPLMYKAIAHKKSVATLYEERLKQEGVIEESEVEKVKSDIQLKMQSAFTLSQQEGDFPTSPLLSDKEKSVSVKPVKQLTGITVQNYIPAILKAHQIPQNFNLHPKLIRLMKQREEMLLGNIPFDWALGEVFAFSSLLMEGIPVRLTGQDSGRGTFSHRHAVWIDQENEARHIPLNHLHVDQACFDIIDSPLSEGSVLGFEYGHSLGDDPCLNLWEAQFGDFANGAQVIIDQFIASGEAKWGQKSGLVLLLPHGFEGQGPEHSSARLERYLQLSAHRNWSVLNCTTPANIFHALRRQVYNTSKKPLVIMTPKSLLRHKSAVSTFQEIEEGTSFQKIIFDGFGDQQSIKKHIFCSGRIYYDLLDALLILKLEHPRIAIHRLEQLYPFPKRKLEAFFHHLHENRSSAREFIWCQEEPKNMGAWTFVEPYFDHLLRQSGFHQRIHYVGRQKAASPATGFAHHHQKEQEEFIRNALL